MTSSLNSRGARLQPYLVGPPKGGPHVGLGVVAVLAVALLASGVRAQPASIRVLFIGNSLTSSNDLPGMIETLARTSGPRVDCDAVAFPNFSLEDHWNRGDAAKAIARGGWNTVILQQGPSALPESQVLLREYTRKFDAEIRRVGARTALYMVWPSAARRGDFDGVKTSYETAARDVGGLFLPVGEAWRAVWRRDAAHRAVRSRQLSPVARGHVSGCARHLSAPHGQAGADDAAAVRDIIRPNGRIAAGSGRGERSTVTAALATVFADVRFALRGLAKHRAFAATAVLSLALGIGVNTGIFTVLRALLLEPLPYKDADRLVILWNRSPGLNIAEDWFSTAQYFDIKQGSSAFDDVAIAIGANYNLAGDGANPERIGCIRISSNLLPMLGAGVAAGRLFDPEEDVPGRSGTAILSYGTWTRRYGRDPSASVARFGSTTSPIRSSASWAPVSACRAK